MKWTKDQSIKLSLICVWIFAAMLLLADILAYRWIPAYITWREMNRKCIGFLTVVFYASSILGWLFLWEMRSLLKNISVNEVFIPRNVRILRIISWCCAFAAIIFLVGTVKYGPLGIIAIAAGFMMLIVRIVKNVFEQAIAMKDELDLTI